MKRFQRKIVIVLLVLIACGGAAFYWLTRPVPVLTVASWGGDYTAAQNAALFQPYTEKYRAIVHVSVYGGGTSDIAAQKSSGTVDWDVVDFEDSDAAKACREGLLEKIDPASLPDGADGRKAAQDFIPGALQPCSVGGFVYAHVIAYVPGKFAAAPAKLSDFFDLERFPGGRGLKASGPEDNLEMALLADGVAPKDVYATLATDEGVTRAFAKFDSIKKNIVWWRKASEPAGLLQDGRVSMTTALNGALFDAAKGANPAPFAILWDGQRYEFEPFGIVKGTAHKDIALSFVGFATDAAREAAFAEHLPYGPARHSALALIKLAPEGADVGAYLPTSEIRLANAMPVDSNWWAEHGPALRERWKAWVAQ
jgi:putative spermidine/putrescine transport system substrate-binding protein